MTAADLPGQNHHRWRQTQDGSPGQTAPVAAVVSDW